MRLSEFNKIFNPYDENCYFSYNSYKTTGKKYYVPYLNLTHIIKSGKVDELEIGYELPETISLLETQDKIFIDFIKAKKLLNTYIIKNKDRYQILFKRSPDDKNLIEYTTNVLSRASIKVLTAREKPYVILPFKDKTNTSSLLKFISEEYEHNLDYLEEIPFELKPLINKQYINHSYKYPVKSRYDAHLKNIIQILKPIISEYNDILKVIKSINLIYFDNNLTEEEIDNIIEEENLIIKTFFNEGQPDYRAISEYVIQKLFIKYDAQSDALFYYDETKNVYIDDEKFLESYLYRLIPILKSNNITEIIDSIKRITYLDKVQFNVDEFKVLFKNGLYDLNEKKFVSMNPSLFETNMIGANYMTTPTPVKIVDDFFKTLTRGNAEDEILLYEAIGYSMFRTNEYQKAFMCYGGGKNGKSTLFNLIKRVLSSENVTKISFKDLENTFRPAKLENKLASIAPDISSSEMEESDAMKSIISGDDVTIEKKNKDSYDRPVYTTMWFGCNKLPRTPDNSYGFYRRFVVIPLKADLSHVKSGEGKQFHDELMKQECVDYVANKALRAFANVHLKTQEFTISYEIQAEIDYYKDISDNVRQFMKTMRMFTTHMPDEWDAERLYSSYKDFCSEKGYKPKGYNNYESSFELMREEEKKKREAK